MQNAEDVPVEKEDLARLRVWARVQLGMAADRRRRRRRASLAAICGAVITTVLVMVVLVF
jgi:hypothetical protein